MMGSAHSRWMIAPGPWMPFSMVKLSPNNQNAGWQAGYDPHLENIGGFSHIHEWTMAGLLMMPTTGPLQVEVGDQYQPDAGYRSRADTTREQARIGYYRTFLSDTGIDVELTATTRAGFQRYTFPETTQARVLLDFQFPAEYRFDLVSVEVRQSSATRIEGSVEHHAPDVWGRDAQQEYVLHFVAEFDRPIHTSGVWTDAGVQPDTRVLRTGRVKDAGVYVEFDTRGARTVQVRTGISLVSLDNADLNLRHEISQPFGWNFAAIVDHQRATWNELLGRIHIETPDRREKVRFYTNLYRSFCRNIWSDVDGRWRDPEERIQQLNDPDAVMLGCDAFWNTFWNLNQVWNLISPEWSSRWVRSQLALYDACGWLAKGPAGLEYIPVMVAEHEIPLIVGAYQMGIRISTPPRPSRPSSKCRPPRPKRSPAVTPATATSKPTSNIATSPPTEAGSRTPSNTPSTTGRWHSWPGPRAGRPGANLHRTVRLLAEYLRRRNRLRPPAQRRRFNGCRPSIRFAPAPTSSTWKATPGN
jgi:putative alpha-1,2-mannosidase